MAEGIREDDKVIPGNVVLTLTVEEAQVLADISGRIGGHPTETRRGLVDNIARALTNAGIYRDTGNVDFDDSQRHQAIYFE